MQIGFVGTLLQGKANQDAQIQKNIGTFGSNVLGQQANQDAQIQKSLGQDQQNQDAAIQNQLNQDQQNQQNILGQKNRHLMSFLPNIGQDINNKVSGCLHPYCQSCEDLTSINCFH